jgi:NAD(P)-dependent dehydrogenase (short-subunit alcohol dehydrogenase family)
MTTNKRAGAILGLIGGGLLLERVWRSRHAISFLGKTVVIIGGSRGLGLVIARELASEGARVVLVARDADELERARADLQTRNADVSTFVCDVRNRHEVDETIERIGARHGSIDVLINDAGIIQVGPLEHMTVADFEDAMATH